MTDALQRPARGAHQAGREIFQTLCIGRGRATQEHVYDRVRLEGVPDRLTVVERVAVYDDRRDTHTDRMPDPTRRCERRSAAVSFGALSVSVADSVE
jgi:hypothetical protein